MIQFQLPDMTCGHCEKSVKAAVAQVDPAATVSVDLEHHLVRIDSAQDRSVLATALADAGYPPAS
ncbi:MAG: heavy-metal-associated domain-containing protein [Lautropia sp.]|nr:heavy-metal-associated domain-containing protein [Lautropia sp.]